ncbi:CHAT domain-containing protein [Aphanothece microscopica]|uniref:CHAT domain-containing protein n=1 Tax=Aphanothece microscopica TaxID=1049561 RepID=UPI0039853358
MARLIRARPDLQASQPDRKGRLRGLEELAALEEGTIEAAALAAPTPEAVTALLEDRCDLLDRTSIDCIAFAHRAAIGGAASTALIRPAYDWLRAAAAFEAAERAERGRLRPYREDSDSAPSRPPAATLALMDVAAFWGDYAGAREAILPLQRLPYVEGLSATARNAGFRRMVARHVEGRPPETWPALATLLEALAQRDDDAAVGFLEIVVPTASPAAPPSAPLTLEEARERLAIAEPLGRESRGLGFAARRLSTLEAAAGDVARATELELLAMETDLARADLAAITEGPLPASLVRVCAWSHASERLFAIGQGDLALIFARTAVNELQTIRAAIAGLPEQVQLCFRDTVADHYRWLADLFITQGRPAEADQILMLLKSFETFRFVGNDIVYSGAATARMVAPEPAAEAEIVASARQVKPTVTGQAIRRRDLLLRKKSTPLTGEETAELEALNASLGAERAARDAVVQDLVDRAAALGRAAAGDRLSDGKSIKRHLRGLETARAAALQYVVLDGRIGIVLTTPVSQRAFVVERIGDKPLTAAALEQEIAAFRAALRDPSADPRPAARRLHDLLLPADLLAELGDGGIARLVLSPDGPLRYIPFAALHDGSSWLVERFALSLATDATVPQAEDPVERISAFGSTRAIAGFSALPGVQRELRALVRGAGSDGLLDGVALLDDAFTRDSLAEALVFGDGFTPELGIVHIASHFKLGRTEADSFLLLGNGDRLTLADLRAGFGIDLDFSEVGLLTLSACETGYGGGSDGAELESFAAVAQQEGARSVVATLWPVEDASIALFMEGIYARQMSGGVPLADAITATQRGFLAGDPQVGGLTLRAAEALEPATLQPLADFPGYTHPFYWAPVVLMQGAS